MKLALAARRIRRHPYLGWIIGIGVFAVAAALRSVLQPMLSGVPFITFFPAVVVAGLFGGTVVCVAVFLLSFFTAWFLFVPPYGSFEIPDPPHRAALILFAFAGPLIVYCVRVLNRTVDDMHDLQQHTETLFKELQHRVANNLTFISAILAHQRRQFDPESAAALALSGAQDRIATMGRVHRLLYNPRGLDRPVRVHLAELSEESINASGRPARADVTGDDAVLDLRRLIPLALIASELVTNSLKHAFGNRSDGIIAVDFRRDGSDFVLRVADNGCGMDPAGATGSGIGQSIVASLATQLRAEMTVEGRNGTIVTVRFPADTAGSDKPALATLAI